MLPETFITEHLAIFERKFFKKFVITGEDNVDDTCGCET